MTLNWLYGPPKAQVDNRIDYRSLVLHFDAIRAVVARLESRGYRPDLTTWTHDPVSLSHTSTQFTIDELSDLPAIERSAITLTARSDAGDVSVPFGSRSLPHVGFNSPSSSADAREVVNILLQEGRARVQWFRLAPLVALVPVAMIGVWIWALATVEIPASLTILGSLVVATCVYLLRTAKGYVRDALLRRFEQGHRIIPVTRDEVYLARGTRRREVTIALIGAASPIVLAGLVALVVNLSSR